MGKFKLSGHTLPGPNQKSSIGKFTKPPVKGSIPENMILSSTNANPTEYNPIVGKDGKVLIDMDNKDSEGNVYEANNKIGASSDPKNLAQEDTFGGKFGDTSKEEHIQKFPEGTLNREGNYSYTDEEAAQFAAAENAFGNEGQFSNMREIPSDYIQTTNPENYRDGDKSGDRRAILASGQDYVDPNQSPETLRVLSGNKSGPVTNKKMKFGRKKK